MNERGTPWAMRNSTHQHMTVMVRIHVHTELFVTAVTHFLLTGRHCWAGTQLEASLHWFTDTSVAPSEFSNVYLHLFGHRSSCVTCCHSGRRTCKSGDSACWLFIQWEEAIQLHRKFPLRYTGGHIKPIRLSQRLLQECTHVTIQRPAG